MMYNTRVCTIRTTQEDSVMDAASRCENSKNTKRYSKSQQQEDVMEDDDMIVKTFPWLPKFIKTTCSFAGSRNYQHLEELLLLYTQNILSSMAGSNVEFREAIILKNHVNNMLMFFHLYWLDIKQNVADHSTYLNKMSALLNVYIDIKLKTTMENRTSIRIRDPSKIAVKILADLYIYLNNSEEHIFRVLLRIKYTSEKYTKICNHIYYIFMYVKSFTNLKTKTKTFITDITYIRYLLAFKIWKKMEGTNKKEIDKLALMLLGSRMPELRNALSEFVPRPPKNQENETLWLLQPSLDLKQTHEDFLLFEDKMDNLRDIQCTEISRADQGCSKSQKHQINLLFRRSNSNEDKSYQLSKDCLGGSQNNNMLKNINLDKSMDQTYLQKKGTKSLKPLKKIKKKPGKTVIIDLTGDNEVSVPCKVKRRKSKCNVECLRMMKNIIKNKKHINSWKYSNELVHTNVKENSNKNSNSSAEKGRLKCKPISDNKVSDSTQNSTSINNKSSLNDNHCINKRSKRNITKMNVCPEFAKKDERQHDYNFHPKLSTFADQNIKEFKTTNILKENKPESHMLSHATYTTRNPTGSCSNPIMQSKDALVFQEESTMETIPLSKMCQNNIADQYSFKQELPTSTNCSAMQKSYKCCKTMPVDVHDIKHLIIEKLKSINNHSSQITEIIKQKVCCQVNERPNCCMKIDCKPFINNDIVAKDTLHNTFNDNENDVKLACDTKNIIYMHKKYNLRDRNKRVYIVNHIDEHDTTIHAEKRRQRLDNSNDTCMVSTTFTEDQILESPLYSQYINFDNVKMNDYNNVAKYSEVTLKEQQKGSNCNPLILNDRIHSSESCTFDINSFEIGPNVDVDDLKNFPKIEADEKTDLGDLEHVSFLDNIQSETLEDFFRQFLEIPQINYDSTASVSTRKPHVYTDNSNAPVKTQDTLHNIFNNDEIGVTSPSNTNIIYMLSDRDKCVYVTNNDGERVMNTSAERKVLDNTNDMCTVSTTFTGDQIVESLDDQHVNIDNRRKGDESKYSETAIKEQQGKSDCDTSMSSDLYTFDMDSLTKIDCIDDFENFGFIHNIQTGTLEDVLSNDTTDFFLSLKQPPFDLDNGYTDTFLNEKDIACNNQNDTIDSSIDPVAFHVNTDNTFLRLPSKSDKSIPVNRNKFQHDVKHFC